MHVLQEQLALAVSAREQGPDLVQRDQHVFLQLGVPGEVQLGHGQNAAAAVLQHAGQDRPAALHVGGQTRHRLGGLAQFDQKHDRETQRVRPGLLQQAGRVGRAERRQIQRPGLRAAAGHRIRIPRAVVFHATDSD